MSKINCVISAPVSTYSGYGARSRDVIKELIRVQPGWNISILPQRWGNCREGYLEDHQEYELLTHIVSNVNCKPDVWIQITVPNEFQPMGTFNIGMTAGMETTACDLSWVEGCNRMDLVIVSSNHGKMSLTASEYQDNRTGLSIKVTTPVEVLFEGIDMSKYYKGKSEHNVLEGVTNPWNFLFVGHWLQGDFGEDRKNVGYTIKLFLETFKDCKNAPGLILKTSRGGSSYLDQKETLDRVYRIKSTVKYEKSLPDIYLLHGDLTDEEMNSLYNDNRVKAMVSFTKGEGYGRPLAEFAATGKPILCSGWSGLTDFLSKEYTTFVGGKLDNVHPSAQVRNMIIPESSWFRPDDNHVNLGLKLLFNKYNECIERAKKQKKIIVTEFTQEKMGDKLASILDLHLPEFPDKVDLSLPDLDCIVLD